MLFVYFHCDQWKMADSLSLVGVFEENKLKEIIIEDIKNGDVELDGRDEEEIQKKDIRTIESLLVYGHIQPIKLNERQ